MHQIITQFGTYYTRKQSFSSGPLFASSGSRSVKRITAASHCNDRRCGHHNGRPASTTDPRHGRKPMKSQSMPRDQAIECNTEGSPGGSVLLPAAFLAESAGLDKRKVLTRSEARQVYDANGRKDLVKDSDSLYGGPATQALLSAIDVTQAKVVYEFGHGSGRLAQRLLVNELPEACTYVGVDQSEVMHSVAATRLEPFRRRVTLLHAPDGEPATSTAGLPPGSVDIFVSTYVLDLLSEEDIFKVLDLAGQLLKEGGQLCLTGLTYGSRVGLPAACATWIWEAVHFLWPKVVGGCRAQTLEVYLGPLWELKSSSVVSGGLVASEVLVCLKRSTTSGQK